MLTLTQYVEPPGASGEMKPCGPCTVCCTVWSIPFFKNAGEACRHLTGPVGEACGNYEDRPRQCEGFNCMWKVSPEMPASLRPDRSGVCIDAEMKDGRKVIRFAQIRQGAFMRSRELQRFAREQERDGAIILLGMGKNTFSRICWTDTL